MKPADPNPYGKCGTCRHWTRCAPGDWRSYCDQHGYFTSKTDTCADYHRREGER